MEGLVTNGEIISFDSNNFKLETIENRMAPIETNVSTLQTNRSVDYSNIVQIIPKINIVLGYMLQHQNRVVSLIQKPCH